MDYYQLTIEPEPSTCTWLVEHDLLSETTRLYKELMEIDASGTRTKEEAQFEADICSTVVLKIVTEYEKIALPLDRERYTRGLASSRGHRKLVQETVLAATPKKDDDPFHRWWRSRKYRNGADADDRDIEIYIRACVYHYVKKLPIEVMEPLAVTIGKHLQIDEARRPKKASLDTDVHRGQTFGDTLADLDSDFERWYFLDRLCTERFLFEYEAGEMAMRSGADAPRYSVPRNAEPYDIYVVNTYFFKGFPASEIAPRIPAIVNSTQKDKTALVYTAIARVLRYLRERFKEVGDE